MALIQGEKLKGESKIRKIPVKVIASAISPTAPVALKKPDWIRVKAASHSTR